MKIYYILKKIIKKTIIKFPKKEIGYFFESISSPYYKVYDEEIKKINDSNDLRKKEKITNYGMKHVLNSLYIIMIYNFIL